MTIKADPSEQQLQQAPSQIPSARMQQQHQSAFGGDLVGSPGEQLPQNQTPPSQLSELDRFGLAGLIDMVRSDNQDVASLAIGQDLTQLGLDLNSSE